MAITEVKAMIFSAGLGTRFKPWTDHHPKALAVVNGKSLLQRNVEYLQAAGITDVVVNVHHFADQVREAVERNKGWGSHIIISNEEDELLDTGGGLLKAKKFLESAPFITINVDVLTNMDLQHLYDNHLQTKSIITLAVTDRSSSRYLLFDENNCLSGWRNTATGEEKIVRATKNLYQKAYTGIACFQPAVFDFIPFAGKFSLIDLYLNLAPNQAIYGFDHSGDLFIDVGKPGTVQQAELLFV